MCSTLAASFACAGFAVWASGHAQRECSGEEDQGGVHLLQTEPQGVLHQVTWSEGHHSRLHSLQNNTERYSSAIVKLIVVFHDVSNSCPHRESLSQSSEPQQHALALQGQGRHSIWCVSQHEKCNQVCLHVACGNSSGLINIKSVLCVHHRLRCYQQSMYQSLSFLYLLQGSLGEIHSLH